MTIETKLPLKPLDWQKVDDDWWGADVEGLNMGYEVRSSPNGTRIRWPGERTFVPFEGSVEEAKAHALQDLSARLSKLVDLTFMRDLPDVEQTAVPKP